jgi:hypothetical protein
MAANSLNLAIANAYAAGRGEVKGLVVTANAQGGYAGMQIPSFGNNTLSFDDNFVYLSTTSGSSNVAANGYTVLPNNIKLNWATMATNSTGAAWTFTSPFLSNAYFVGVTPATALNGWVTTVNNTVAQVFSSGVGAAANVRVFAVGS